MNSMTALGLRAPATRSGDIFSDFVGGLARQGASSALTPAVIAQVSDGVVQRLMAAGVVQQITDAAVPRLLADTAFQSRVGAAAGTSAAKELALPVYIAAGALGLGAIALVVMAVRRVRSNPSRRAR